MTSCNEYKHFTDTRSQENCRSSIRVGLKNLKVISSFRFEFTFESFVIFKNLLTNLVVNIYMLFIRMKQSIIDQLLSMCKDCVPICMKRDSQKLVLR